MDNQEPIEMPKGMKKEFLSFLKVQYAHDPPAILVANNTSRGNTLPLLMTCSIASFKGDLASFTAPPFILSTTSMAEFPTYWVEQPARFVAPSQEPNPSKRALLVLTWFLTTLKQQYDMRKDRKKGKPLNPVLGEHFLGSFPGSSYGTTQVISEQVSHHPPVTAYRMWNNDAGMSLEGYHAAKTFFAKGMIHLHKVGQVVLHIDKYNEDYLLTNPQVHLTGFLPPPPFAEFDSDTPAYIQSTSGYTTKITFSGKGWLRGKRNSFFATLYAEGRESEPLYTAEGQWTGTFTIKDVRRNEVIETYDATTSVEKLAKIDVAPLDEQDALESRRLWRKFTEAMERRDMAGVSAEKNRIEVRQREMRKEEEREGRKWQTKYFSNTGIDPKVEALCAKIGFSIQPELTAGFWQFDEEKYRHAAKTQDDPFGDDKAVPS
ncbi:Oxysterol-binding protein 4 [Lithohypha guttulata]|uniref:Oxysterol-binding protein 4 n=1 Tax=Lithohypha guttulata TaxID=1690604 RepID=UPI002DE1A54A|nr:Oxysterol-binding protein 4 [Lithohypha guttulata]